MEEDFFGEENSSSEEELAPEIDGGSDSNASSSDNQQADDQNVEENSDSDNQENEVKPGNEGNHSDDSADSPPQRQDSESEQEAKSDDSADEEKTRNQQEGNEEEANESSDGSQTPIQSDNAESDGEENKPGKTADSSDESDNDQVGGDSEKKSNDLFGDADDISSDSDKEKDENQDDDENTEARTNNAIRYSDEDEMGSDNEHAKDESQEEEIQETRIEVEIPKINTDLGNAVHFVRFPNFVSVETRPFDPNVYEDEIDEDELLDEEGRTRLKLKCENTIRWRKYTDENGIELTESNSRVVRWSDGSMSLYLGSEIFDVHVMPLQGDHNHLFIRQGTGLQGQAVFKTKLTFRPHSTKSATHRKMTNRLAMRLNQNQQKVRVLPIAGQNPETRKAKLMKEEEDQLKAHMRREAQKRRMRERQNARGLTASYLDDRMDEDESEDSGAISLSAIKNRYKPGGGGIGKRDNMHIYSSDSDSAEERQLLNAKRIDSDNSDSESGNKDAEKGEGDAKKKKYVVSDDEDSDNADGAGGEDGDANNGSVAAESSSEGENKNEDNEDSD